MSIEVTDAAYREAMQDTIARLINENIQLKAVIIQLETALQERQELTVEKGI